MILIHAILNCNSPSQVQIIYVCEPVAMVIFSTLITEVASAGLGRVQAKLGECCAYLNWWLDALIGAATLLLSFF